MKRIPGSGYIALNKSDEVDVTPGGLIISGAESNKMVVARGEIVMFAQDIRDSASEESDLKNLSEGWKLYYNKGGSFDLRLEDGTLYTMVHIRDAILFIPPENT